MFMLGHTEPTSVFHYAILSGNYDSERAATTGWMHRFKNLPEELNVLTFNCFSEAHAEDSQIFCCCLLHVCPFEYNDGVIGCMWVKMCIHMYICLIIRRGSKSDISFDIPALAMQSMYHPLPFHFRKPTDASIIPSFCVWVDKLRARYLPTTVMKHSMLPHASSSTSQGVENCFTLMHGRDWKSLI